MGLSGPIRSVGSLWAQVNFLVFGEGFFFQIFFEESHLGIGAIADVVTNDVNRSQHRTQYDASQVVVQFRPGI